MARLVLDPMPSGKSNLAMSLMSDPRFAQSNNGLRTEYQILMRVVNSLEHIEPERLRRADERLDWLDAEARRRGISLLGEIVLSEHYEPPSFIIGRS